MGWVENKIVSIHAPRVGRDKLVLGPPSLSKVSIHAPRVGRDKDNLPELMTQVQFQSTRPVWGATSGTEGVLLLGDVSIHAPRVGRDLVKFARVRLASLFQSTRPVWGATHSSTLISHTYYVSIHAPRVGRDFFSDWHDNPRIQVSIHAPRVGRDGDASEASCVRQSFNPRAPCGARL